MSKWVDEKKTPRVWIYWKSPPPFQISLIPNIAHTLAKRGNVGGAAKEGRRERKDCNLFFFPVADKSSPESILVHENVSHAGVRSLTNCSGKPAKKALRRAGGERRRGLSPHVVTSFSDGCCPFNTNDCQEGSGPSFNSLR